MTTASNKTPRERPRILVVDDERDMLTVLGGWLDAAGFEPITAANGKVALSRFDESIAAVLMDVRMPGMDGIETLTEMRKRIPDIQCVMVTGEKDARTAVTAMKAGAFDYVTKPPNADELLLLVKQAVRTQKLGRDNVGLRAALSGSRTAQRWIGDSSASEALLKKAKQVAQSDSAVLITGETGTGKSLLARMIHELSPRNDQPFITVSCAAIPRELVESELFGHEKGAFTGATRQRPGKMEIVEQGTIFLDEIGEVPLAVQPKVLRVLQEREFERVGGNKTFHMNARIIAATNRDLDRMCDANEFREDLFYRLNVLHLHVPPLRERREDIRPLVEQLLTGLCTSLEVNKKLADAAWTLMQGYEWPGNVRELQNVLERAVTFSEGKTIKPDDLAVGEVQKLDSSRVHSLAGMTLVEIEKKAIEDTLASCEGNKAEAARRLGISEKTIYNKIKKLKIDA